MMLAPASRKALILASAVALSPVMIAPACPIRLPGGAEAPTTSAEMGLVNSAADIGGGVLLHVAADLPDQHHGVGVVIFLEQPEHLNKAGADDGVAANTDAGGLPDAQAGELPHGLVGQGAAAGDDACPARQVDCSGHDADLATGARVDESGAVGADQPHRLVLEIAGHPHHVESGNTLGYAGDQGHARVGGLDYGIGRKWRRHER